MELDRQSRTPFYRRLYERFRDEIVRGHLVAGERLPSARRLADQLGVARGTVDLAYELLSSEGFVRGRGAAGTFVAPDVTRLSQPVGAKAKLG